MLRTIMQVFFRIFFKLLSRVTVYGAENVPKTGGLILAANHVSILDAPLVFSLVDRKDLSGLVADKYAHNPLIGPIVKVVDGIWINREGADTQALRRARDYLQAGHALGIAPEGTRSPTGALIPAKTGVAYLADKAGATIVPVAIHGTEQIFTHLKRLSRAQVGVHFGEPLVFPRLERSDRDRALERNTDQIMCRIAAMLPPQYHGVYAGHACLEERPGELLLEKEQEPVRDNGY